MWCNKSNWKGAVAEGVVTGSQSGGKFVLGRPGVPSSKLWKQNASGNRTLIPNHVVKMIPFYANKQVSSKTCWRGVSLCHVECLRWGVVAIWLRRCSNVWVQEIVSHYLVKYCHKVAACEWTASGVEAQRRNLSSAAIHKLTIAHLASTSGDSRPTCYVTDLFWLQGQIERENSIA
jgi:hypothetical protein